ncbi:MAG TPA: hypothetical protein VGG61_03485 [Gemmataceae bacterium]|jgi:hypothetical protein
MKGEVVYLYAFDVANEIVTAKIQSILSQTPFPFEIREERTIPRDIPLYKPLTVEPPPTKTCLGGRSVRILIRIYEVGVVSIAARVEFTAESLAELARFHGPLLDDGRPIGRFAEDLCAEVCRSLDGLLIRPAPPMQPEAYTAFCLTDLGAATDANSWLADERRNVAGLLAETAPDRLSEGQVAEVLRLQRSFENTDLVVIDWDAALVVDLKGYVDDVLYVLELANLQLEEFRVMDGTLDSYLNRAYEDLERRRFPVFGVARGVLGELRRFRVDVTKLADEVTHITKFFGDWYLARVYLGARERFALDQWRGSVEKRLAQLDQIYSVVHGDVYDRRMLWLEIIIVVLFVIDLVAIIFFKR